MNTWAKVGIAAAVLGGVAYAIFAGAKSIVEGITYKVTKFGIPQVSGTTITIPITMRLSNASIVPIPVEQIQLDLSYRQNGVYISAGHLVHAGFDLNPGDQEVTLYPTLDVKALLTNVVDTLKTALTRQALSIKTDVLITIKGITATDTLYNDVPVNLSSAISLFR